MPADDTSPMGSLHLMIPDVDKSEDIENFDQVEIDYFMK
jgi:hypothetical protein